VSRSSCAICRALAPRQSSRRAGNAMSAHPQPRGGVLHQRVE
jgi:hypothetical protein